MGTTVLLSQLTTTTEFLIIDLVAQQGPEPDSQLSCRCYFRFPQTFLHQLVLIKTLQLRIPTNHMPHRFTPQKTSATNQVLRCELPWNRAATGRRILFVAEGGHGIEPRRAVRRQIAGENGHGS
jgi:hypothetical protein